MKCLAILAAGALILAPAALWAAPDDAPEGAVATTQASISMSMTTTGSGADRRVRIEIGGDWDSLPETARRSVLDSLKTMLPEAALKTVLKRIVSGDRVIEVSAPEKKELRSAPREEVIEIEQCGPMIEIEDEEIVEDPVIRDGGMVLRGRIVMPKSAMKAGGGGCGGGEAEKPEKPAGCKGDGSCGACTGEDKAVSSRVMVLPKDFTSRRTLVLRGPAKGDRILSINGKVVRDRDAAIRLLKQGEAIELLDRDNDEVKKQVREALEALKDVRALQGDVKDDIESVEEVRRKLATSVPMLKLHRARLADEAGKALRKQIQVETDLRIIGPDGNRIVPGKDGIVILRQGAKSDASGRLHIEGMKPGRRQIRVQALGAPQWSTVPPEMRKRLLDQLKGSLDPEAMKLVLKSLQGGGHHATWFGPGRPGRFSDDRVIVLGGRPSGCPQCGPKAQGRRGCGDQGPKAQGRRGCGDQGLKAQGRRGCGGQGPEAQGRRGCGGHGPKAQGRRGCGGHGPKAQGRRGPGGHGPEAQGRRGPGGHGPEAQGPRGPGGQGPGPDVVIRALEALRREMEALRREFSGARGMHGGMRPPAPPHTGFAAPAPPKVPVVAGRRMRIAMPKGGAAGTSFYAVKPATGKLEARVRTLQAEISKQNALIQKLLARVEKLEADTAK